MLGGRRREALLGLARAVMRFCFPWAGKSPHSWDHPVVGHAGNCLLLLPFPILALQKDVWRNGKKKKKSCMCPLNMHLFLLLVLSLTLQAALLDLHFALRVVVSAGGEQAPTEGEL